MSAILEIENKIYDTFAEVASSLGYSPLHGKIIGVLLVSGKALSLDDVAKETGYSPSMVSLSLDLLEVLGIIKKVKKTGDRKLYLELHGDLLEALKNAIIIKLEKSVRNSLTEFEKAKEQLKAIDGDNKNKVLKTISVLEGNIKRLEMYVNLLAEIQLP